ncbi:MAG: zonular occludens toxin domain-containing protein [Armatimonadota bacterium]
MIEIIEGLPGSGKTLEALRRILVARREKRRVIANFHSKKNIWEFGLWEDFINAENALCVIDEAQMWLGSRTWDKRSVDDLAVFQQSRKNGLDLICIAQHHKRIDVAVREVCAYLYQCRSAFGNWASVRKYSMDDHTKVIHKRIFKRDKSLFDHYWTTEVIGAADGTGYRFGAATQGGIVRLENGNLTPNMVEFRAPDFNRLVPIDQADEEWWRIVKLYGGKGYICDMRPLAVIEGKKYYTDENRPVGAEDYGLVQQIIDSRFGQNVLKIEDKIMRLA